MFCVNLVVVKSGHGDRLRQFSTIVVREACGITGRTCGKFPPSRKILPPQGLSSLVRSRSSLSIACNACNGIIDASSIIMRLIERSIAA